MGDDNTISWLEVLTEMKSLLEADPEIDLTESKEWPHPLMRIKSAFHIYSTTSSDGYLEIGARLGSRDKKIISEGHVAHRAYLLISTPGQQLYRVQFGRNRLGVIFHAIPKAALKKARLELVLPELDPNRVRKSNKTTRFIRVQIPQELYNRAATQAAANGVTFDEYVNQAFQEHLERLEEGKE